MSSYANEKTLLKHKQKCEQQEIPSNKTSTEPHICWKKCFHKVNQCFRIYSDFEAANEIENFKIGGNTTSNYEQSPLCNGYYIVSDLNDILQSG